MSLKGIPPQAAEWQTETKKQNKREEIETSGGQEHGQDDSYVCHVE